MSVLPYPGVTITETDNSSVITRSNTGVPAGVVGTAASGPAFVPLVFGSYANFTEVFGKSGGRFGPIAVNYWLDGSLNSNATYLRVLGAGDGLKRSSSTGAVNYAGFTVGEKQVLSTGIVGNNPYANAGGIAGRTYFIGCYMSESAGSTIFSSAGIQDSSKAFPIIRGIVMTPSGVSLTLSGNTNTSNTPTTIAASNGSVSGSIGIADSTFVMLLNGHIATEQYPNVITASMSTNDYAGSYFPTVFNKDPTKYQEAGHFLYSWYDVPTSTAVITGTLILNHATASADPNKHDAIFITSSSIGRDTSNASTPNYEQFKERYTHPQSPFVVSQDYGGTRYNLFRIHSISDGYVAGVDYTPDLANSLKVTISNIVPADSFNPYPTFDVSVRSLNQADDNFSSIKEFLGVTLNPNSEFYIASKIGDQNIYFDFDRANGSQKIAVEGDYPVTNNYIRLELSDDFIAGNVPEDAIPAGFRGYGYIFTSGSSLATFGSANAEIVSGQSDVIKRALIPPVPMRLNLNDEAAPSDINSNLTWGSQVEEITSLTVPNESTAINKSIGSFIKFFPSYDTTGKKFFIENSTASDLFENNLFTIENIQVVTSSTGIADNTQWISASYIRQGNITANDTNKTRALQVSDLSDSTNRDNVAFTFFLQGGFDGTNIFDVEKSKLTDLAAMREIDDVANQGGVNGPTVMSYKKAVDIMGSTSDVTMQLFAMPGIRVPAITNYAISAIENRFDALYLMDIQQKNELNSYITSSADGPSVVNTVADFKTRSLNTSFAAAYFPDVIVQVPDETSSSTSSTPRTVVVPPSAAVLSAYAKNDVYAPWYAPAGSTRGVISRTNGLAYDLSETDASLGTIYDADINPIVELSGGTGTVVTWGQKTLLKTASSLDRVNVRRLLIDVRRRVRAVANSLLFEPNTQATLAKFNSLVNPIMQDVQTRFGVTRYKVVIDTSTTTQADIDNNTIRGKIFLQPVRTAEFISIDFTISPRSTT